MRWVGWVVCWQLVGGGGAAVAAAPAGSPLSATATGTKLAPKTKKRSSSSNSTTVLPKRPAPLPKREAPSRCVVKAGIDGVEFWALNTDAQALEESTVANRMVIGKGVTRGLGAGGVPAVGRNAASESVDDVSAAIGKADLCFVTGGMGGGTGSGAAPVVAAAARKRGALTVGVVTTPFHFEGKRRMQQAIAAIRELQAEVDTLIVVSNEKLLTTVPEDTSVTDAFLVADDVLRQGIEGISDIILKPGVINVDFADVRTIMTNGGAALMGIGSGKGTTRAADAARAAITSPLLDFPINRAKGIVFNIQGGSDLTLQEINAAAEVIYDAVDPDANIIFGAVLSDRVQQEVSITVLATGFDLTHLELTATSHFQPSHQPAYHQQRQPSSLPALDHAPPTTKQQQQQQQPPTIPAMPGFLPRFSRKPGDAY